MRRIISGLALAALLPSPLAAADGDKGTTPGDIVAAAPAGDWVRIAPDDLVVMDLAADARGRARRVVIQLMPAPFSQGWVDNIRKLVAARWFDGVAVVRVQDNYVVQWGDPDGEVPGRAKPLPTSLAHIGEDAYVVSTHGPQAARIAGKLMVGALERDFPNPGNGYEPSHKGFASIRDSYAFAAGLWAGWPIALGQDTLWPLHCYGMVGVGRNLSPDTGSGAELYTVIGQAPRQLDRNIALVGRVIAGIEHLSSLPRGTGPLGFYETAPERTAIVSVRMGGEVAALPAYEYLSTESASFAAYVDKRANRKDDFYIRPAGGVDVCNVPVPIREATR